MKMVIPNFGKLQWLARAMGTPGAVVEDYSVRLYINDYTPTFASETPNFVEAFFGGYARVTLTPADFDEPVLFGNSAKCVTDETVAFTSADPFAQTAYGWFMVGATTGICLAAQRFDVPRVISLPLTEQLVPFQILLDTLV
jgi:hypothetical protein